MGFVLDGSDLDSLYNLNTLKLIDSVKILTSEKGIKTRNNKTIITTFGVRTYLFNLIANICIGYGKKLN